MEDKPFEFIRPTGKSRFVLTCEHASASIPSEYGTLGLPESELNRHIARDKGAGGVCRLLAEKLGCAAFLGKYSRLLIDLNRAPGEKELIVTESDGTVIPGNLNLSEAEQQRRIEAFYNPYYNAVDTYIADMRKQGIQPVLFSIHSYTPQLKGGTYRPWQAGVLYHNPVPFADYLYRGLVSSAKTVGENVPYDLRRYNTGTVVLCGEHKEVDYGLIEIRDDEFSDLAFGTQEWAQILADLAQAYEIEGGK